MGENKKLKIGIVLDTTLDSTDGVQQYVINLGKWLSQHGHQVYFLVGESKRQDIKNIISLSRNISVRFNGNKTSIPLPVSKKTIEKTLDNLNLDIFHVQMPYSPFLAHRIVTIAKERNKPVIGTFHIAPYDKLSLVGNRILRHALSGTINSFDKIFSVSNAAQDFAKHTYKLESTISPNTIDYKKFSSAKMISNNPKVIELLFLGRLVERKGCQKLLEALLILSKSKDIPNFHLSICGKGYLEAKLKQFIVNNNITDLVDFKGFVEESEKPKYYASSDISIFPSLGGESFGIVLIEAMANGHAAVLAGDNIGYRSVMHEMPDLLFDPHNSQELADKIKELLRSKEIRNKYALWGKKFSKKFDINIIAPQILETYYQALHNSSAQ